VDAGITLDPLKSLTKQAIACLPQEDMCEVTIELFADVLGNYSKFLTDEDFTLLFSLFNSSWSEEHYKQLIQGDYSFESLQYGHFIIALGDARIDEQRVMLSPKTKYSFPPSSSGQHSLK
jgi:hypothetical protein